METSLHNLVSSKNQTKIWKYAQEWFKNGKHNKKLHLIKNNKSNLVVLCSKCHDEVDRENIIIKGWKKGELLYK